MSRKVATIEEREGLRRHLDSLWKRPHPFKRMYPRGLEQAEGKANGLEGNIQENLRLDEGRSRPRRNHLYYDRIAKKKRF